MEKRKRESRTGTADRQEEETRRESENATAADVGVTRTVCPNGATECDVSGLRATRRTYTVDTLQTKGILSFVREWEKDENKRRGKNESHRKERPEEGETRRKTRGEERKKERERNREKERERKREREQLTDTVTNVRNDGERHRRATGCPGAYSGRGCDPEKLDGDVAIRDTKRNDATDLKLRSWNAG